MGSQNCGGFEEGKLSSQAYGDFWVLEHKGSRKAKIVKLIEKQGVVKQTIEESLIKRCQIKHANICKCRMIKASSTPFISTKKAISTKSRLSTSTSK